MKEAPPLGIVFWIIFPAFATLEVVDPRWYDDFQRADWINLGVALGTLALAAITAWNVAITRKIMNAEDQRHRQSLAPIVNAWPHDAEYGHCLQYVNMGPGPALNVSIEYIVAFYDRGTLKQRTLRIKRNVLSANLGNLQEEPTILTGIPLPATIHSVPTILVRYNDMFGAPYESQRTPESFSWHPPWATIAGR